jgi:tRNA modification GTPase
LLQHPKTGLRLDDALALWFPAPKSFTGEDVVELHVHGGRAVVRGVLEALGGLDGLRPAEPGEFTRRAFEHGKLDLTRAEALADLIDAETEAQRVQALGQLAGRLQAAADGWRAQVLEALALVEAAIDFSDEGDVAQNAVMLAAGVARRAAGGIKTALADGHRGEIIRAGFHMVIIGPPNVGKSSLLNRIAEREAAIVSDEAGTTRDVIDVVVDLGGVPVRFSDTAGLRETEGKVEREGIKRAMARAQDSHLILLISSPDVPFRPEDYPGLDLAGRARGTVLRVENKADLLAAGDARRADYAVSCATGAGVDRLVSALEGIVRERVSGGEEDSALVTQARHRAHLEGALAALERFFSATAAPDFPLELAAEELRGAGAALGRITGRIDPEEVLGEIFGRFCIGK